MAKDSLFAILSRSPWWLSVAIAAAVFSGLALVLPELIAAAAAIPFAVIGVYAGWKQLRNPGPAAVARRLGELRALSWPEFSALIEAAFRRDGYTVTKVAAGDVDFELTKGVHRCVVCCKRWKAASTGIGPLRELRDAGRAREASEYVYVAAGDFTANAREFAAANAVRLVNDAALVKLVARLARHGK